MDKCHYHIESQLNLFLSSMLSCIFIPVLTRSTNQGILSPKKYLHENHFKQYLPLTGQNCLHYNISIISYSSNQACIENIALNVIYMNIAPLHKYQFHIASFFAENTICCTLIFKLLLYFITLSISKSLDLFKMELIYAQGENRNNRHENRIHSTSLK